MRVYCHSVILMYFFDLAGPLNVRATKRLAELARAGDSLTCSDLVRLECRVKPIQTSDAAKLAVYDEFVARPDIQHTLITRAVFDRATVLRATHKFKLADALHLAAAIEGGCDVFLTNDARLSSCPDIPVEILP